MDISGNYTLYAPRERVWAALLDPDLLKQTIPGCERLDKEREDTFLLRLNVGVASVKGVYDGKLRLSDLHPSEHYHLTVDGKGARGVLHGDGTLSLDARDATTTVISYTGKAQLGGPIASVGMRVAGSAANMLIKTYFSRLADLLAESASVAPAAPSGDATADILPEEVLDSPLEGPPSMPVEAAEPIGTPTPTVSAESTPAPAVSPAASAAVAVPARGPLMQLARRVGLRRWFHRE